MYIPQIPIPALIILAIVTSISQTNGRAETSPVLVAPLVREAAVSQNPGAWDPAPSHSVSQGWEQRLTSNHNIYPLIGQVPSTESSTASEENPESLTKAAREALRAQQSERAEAFIRRALTIAPNDTDALVLLGQILQKLQRPEEALASYQRVTMIAPGYCDAWFGQSDAYIKLKQLDAASASLQNAPGKCQTQPDAIAAHARLAFAQGEFEGAKNLFLQAYAAQPNDDDLWQSAEAIKLFRNNTSLETERFRNTGHITNLSNIFTYRPRRQESYDLITEHFTRNGQSSFRNGLGGSWSTPEGDATLHMEIRQAADDEVVPSRYTVDGAFRLLRDPGTELLLSAVRIEGHDADLDSRSSADMFGIGIRQYFNECLYAELTRQQTEQRRPSSASAGVTIGRISYAIEKRRTLSLAYAQGDELFAFNTPSSGANSLAYSVRSISASWQEWLGVNWGMQVSGGKTERGNGNDSTNAGIGLFFHF